ncbi:polysaccharide deacetylase family protein [Acidaminobacter hydrogenoformans]|uniref:Peptidoglycan/xylan/chitin deacetylase, PgdA/CDA1 family n=1 Tax=Acidaminobacter hydrogenoformans DSM 2784 TaxID=1120920 RepID=A0A1G5RWC2_9FIRM|nr:polysaccharide deacetylase family protein [Acidaminobacter hydrogenoformans]SCZ77609.1 Peptidoglycan/xylan/chitin deacetylase, PgdA/CDA1 family [Acidaminobacter hydrogenoformans DSM 2784]
MLQRLKMIGGTTRHSRLVLAVITVSLVLAGCNASVQPETAPSENPAEVQNGEDLAPVGENAQPEAPEAPEAPEVPEAPEIDFQVVKPNELGEVMVIMYHSLGEKNSDYVRTADSFREDLKRLYEMGFRTLPLRDLVKGDISTPAGFSPVVLTFDDGHISNFRLLEDGSIDPNSVVGIMSDFAAQHPDFGMHATFFFNGGTPFGQKDSVDFKFNFMLEKGMDIGNHSFGHEHFKSLSAQEVEVSLGKNAAALKAQLPASYEIDLLALPYGERPAEGERATLVEGQFEGQAYKNIAILNVGWKPSVSPFDASFDFASIQRVQSGDGHLQLTDWLDGYEANPKKRFISDGRADRVAVPAALSEKVDLSRFEGLEIITYVEE